MRPENDDFDVKRESPEEEHSFSLEDILSEYRYDNAVKGRRSKQPITEDTLSRLDAETDALLADILNPDKSKGTLAGDAGHPSDSHAGAPSDSDDILAWENALSMSKQKNATAKQAKAQPEKETSKPAGESGEMLSAEFDFANNEEFQRMFAPSNDYLGEPPHEPDAHADAPVQRQREPLLGRLNERAHRLKEVVKNVSPADAEKKLAPYVRSLTFRSFAVLGVCVITLYFMLAHRFGLPFPNAIDFIEHTYRYVFISMALQLLAMFCGMDVLARGIADLLRLRPNIETGVTISCLASIVHVFSILFFGSSWHAYLPYCGVSVFSIAFAVWSARLRYGSRMRTYAVARDAAICQSVTMEDRIWEDVAGVTKREAVPDSFVPQTESPDNVQRFFGFFTPFAIITSIVLAFLVSFGTANGKDFWWAWSAILSCITPFSALLAFVLPFNAVSRRVSLVGVALAGWSAARQMVKANVAVLTDCDIFPGDTVSLNGVKVIGTHAYDKVISYTASVAHASGSGLSRPFIAFFKGDMSHLKRITDFQHYEGGGMGAYIGSDRVLVGTYNFMISMSVSVPSDLKTKHAVYTAINMELVAVFAMIYSPLGSVRSALHMLSHHKVQPMFAVRDFNLTAPLLREKFKLDDSQIDYPVIEERLQLSDPARKVYAKPVAVAGKEGLLSYAECIVGSLSLAKTAKLNLLLSTICAIVGLLVVFYLIYSGNTSAVSIFNEQAATVSPVNILLYQLLWSAPVLIISGWSVRY